MRYEFWLGWVACLGFWSSSCSSGGDPGGPAQPDPGNTSGAGGDTGGPARPGPGEAPTVGNIGPGLPGEIVVPDLPDIFGPGFGGTAFPSSSCTADCEDFPAEPLIEAGGGAAITQEDIARFAAPDDFAAGNLCVVEPQLSNGDVPGALFPANWLRPRFRWEGGGTGVVYEIRLQNEIQVSDLRVYTRQNEWVMPAQLWKDVARNVHTPITVTIRAADGGGALVTGTRGTFQIAPVNAGGSLVFWATTSSEVLKQPVSSQLVGFSVGEEGVIKTLDATDVALGAIVGEDGIEPRGNYAEAVPGGFEPGEVACVGCHISTPDGAGVVFTDNWPWNKIVSSILPANAGTSPDYLTDGASLALSQPWLGTQTMTPAHFAAGDRMLITSYGLLAPGTTPTRTPWDARVPTRHGLAWFDLEAEVVVADRSEVTEFAPSNNYTDGFTYPVTPSDLQVIPANPPGAGRLDRRQLSLFRQLTVANAQGSAWDVMATNGETLSAVTPDWSHDGEQLVYVSTDITSSDGHPDWTADVADIKMVPYNDGEGGAVEALDGASEPGFLEYYPAFSSDDAFVLFARAPNPSNPTRTGCTPETQAQCQAQNLGQNPDGPYYNRNGEIYVVSSGGGEPVRLVANDPVACTGDTVRGSINSWPKWSPRVVSTEGKTYYFLIFSSARQYDGRFQLQTTDFTPPVLPNSSQLYMASIVVDDATGAVTTYPAIYVWNQNTLVDAEGNPEPPLRSSNLTPAWDEFLLPPIVIQ